MYHGGTQVSHPGTHSSPPLTSWHSYFRPQAIHEFGSLQDGGMRANNPTEAGLWELAVLWPTCARPALVVSVGTGSQRSPVHELEPPRGRWRDGFVSRILRAFLSSPCLHGQNSWLALMNRLDAETRSSFLRLNVEFDGAEPALDDTEHMADLRRLARHTAVDVGLYRDRIWASSFFFELVQPPTLQRGLYLCHGLLRSRFDDARPVLQAITRSGADVHVEVDRNVFVKLGRLDHCCRHCGSLALPIHFDVRRLEDAVNIVLAWGDSRRYPVSGSPHPMQWFVDAQNSWLRGYDGGWRGERAGKCCATGRKRRSSSASRGPRKRTKTTG